MGSALDAARRHVAKLRAAGLCITCRQPNDQKTYRCRACTVKAVATNMRIKAEAQASGQCAKCRKPWVGQTKLCPSCKAAARDVWERRTETDNCSRCGAKRDSKHKACSACRAIMRKRLTKRRNEYAAKGLCVQCGRARDIPTGLFCAEHLLRVGAHRWLGSASRWTELRDMLAAQGNACAYTGEPLVLGVNASIDHKTPRSRGGPNVISNLHWVSWTANRAKTDMTHEEFLAMCRTVAARFPPVNQLATSVPASG